MPHLFLEDVFNGKLGCFPIEWALTPLLEAELDCLFLVRLTLRLVVVVIGDLLSGVFALGLHTSPPGFGHRPTNEGRGNTILVCLTQEHPKEFTVVKRGGKRAGLGSLFAGLSCYYLIIFFKGIGLQFFSGF